MDFEYTEEQRLLAETLRRFLATGYSFDARAKIMASAAGYSEDVWAALAEMGVLGVPFDAEHGGYGGSTVDMMIVMEALGEALVVEPYLATVGLGGRFVARGGTAAQQKRVLPDLTQGKTKLAFAQTERGGRYDLAPGRDARAARPARAGCWTARRARSCTAAARICSWSPPARRAATRTPTASASSSSSARAPGVAVSEHRTIDNLRLADVRFSGVAVSRDALIGAEGRGLGLAEEVVDYATVLLCAEAVGAMKYAHDATLEYLKTRRQFGVPIGSFQALQHRMVDILISCEQARSIACLAAVKIDSGGGGRAAARGVGGQDQDRRRGPPREPGGGAAPRRYGHDRGAEDQPHVPAPDHDRPGLRRRRPPPRALRQVELTGCLPRPAAAPRSGGPPASRRRPLDKGFVQGFVCPGGAIRARRAGAEARSTRPGSVAGGGASSDSAAAGRASRRLADRRRLGAYIAVSLAQRGHETSVVGLI